MKKSVDLQAKYYNKKHRDIEFDAGELVLLSTRKLKMKRIPEKLKRDFGGPSRLNSKLDSKRINCNYQRIRKFIPCFIFLFVNDGMLQVYKKMRKFQ